MSDNKEKISAYLDDALSIGEIDELSAADQVAQGQKSAFCVAMRYQLIGDALRGQLGDASMVDVRTGVQEAVRGESVFSETPDSDAHLFYESQIVFTKKRPVFDKAVDAIASWFTPAFFKPLGGLAVAASVAAIMVFSVNSDDRPDGGLLADNADGQATVVSLPVAAFEADNPGVHNVSVNAQRDVNLDPYLAEHAEFAAQDTMQGRMPYVRAVSYKPE